MLRCRPVTLLLLLLASPLVASDGDLDVTYHPPKGFADVGMSLLLGGQGAIDPAGLPVWVGSLAPSSVVFRQPESAACVHDLAAFSGATAASVGAATFDDSGRLLIVGTATYPALGRVIFVERWLYPACTLDSSFDGDGYFTFHEADDVYGLRIATTHVLVLGIPRERIVVAGEVRRSAADSTDVILLRLDGSGNLDTSFGGGLGSAVYDFDDQTNTLGGFRVDHRGRLVIDGTLDPAGFDPDGMIARILPDGTLDDSFSVDGWLRFEQDGGIGGQGKDFLGALVLGSDDSVYTVGTIVFDSDSSGAATVLSVTHFSPSGLELDDARILVSEAAGGQDLIARDAVLERGGRLLIAGGTHLEGSGEVVFSSAFDTVPQLANTATWGSSIVHEYTAWQDPASPDSAARGISIGGDGRPILFLDTMKSDGRHGIVARLANRAIFSDGFEAGSTFYWTYP